uniref:Uncharacterized protein n=1 Tax=Tetranychus urticae TaxID=32264 RepID=T1KLT5_TETUR
MKLKNQNIERIHQLLNPLTVKINGIDELCIQTHP